MIHEEKWMCAECDEEYPCTLIISYSEDWQRKPRLKKDTCHCAESPVAKWVFCHGVHGERNREMIPDKEMATNEEQMSDLLAFARCTHGFIMCTSDSDEEVLLKHSFNRTFCEVRIPVEVWALFLRSAKEVPIYHGSMKNADYPEEG